MHERNSKRTYLLHDLDVFEVSLVRKPANGRSFYMTKSADKEIESMDDEKFMAILETPTENESKLDEVIKEEMSHDAVRAVRAALRLLDAFKDEIPSETLAGLADAAGMDMHMEEEKAMHRMYKDDEEATPEPEVALKSDDIPEELRPHIEALWKSNQEAQEKVSALEEVLKSERDEKLLRAESDRVTKEFGHVPGMDAPKLAQLLINIRKSAPDSAEGIESLLSATERAMVAKEGGAFEEAGTTVTPDPVAATAWGRIEAMATELVQKGETESRSTAIDQVLTDNPQLYADYLNEKGA